MAGTERSAHDGDGGVTDPSPVADTADVDRSAQVGAGTRIWQLAQVREGAVLGTDCIVGRGAYVGAGVRIGDRVKIQNSALVYEPAELADDVFVGPAAVLTNDRQPRAVRPDGARKTAADWSAAGVRVGRGASLGAGSVCVAPLSVGAWAMVGAGAVVTRDVPDFALVTGTPARQTGWVGRAGERLEAAGEGRWRCPVTGQIHLETPSGLVEEQTP